MDDRELMKLLRRRPEEGFRQLMELYMGAVCTVVRARLGELGTREDVEDCVSETFAAFYRALDRVDLRRGTVKTFLCAIARNRSIDCYKALVRSAANDPWEEERPALAASFSLEEAYITEETRREVVEEIAALDQPDREILVRRFLLGQPSRAVAQALDMTVSAVDTRTHRALKKLKTKMEEMQP